MRQTFQPLEPYDPGLVELPVMRKRIIKTSGEIFGKEEFLPRLIVGSLEI